MDDCGTFPRMPGPGFSKNAPQFGTAQYSSQGGAESCKSCNQPIGAEYYRINGVLACQNCAQAAAATLPKDSHAAFVRGIIFGVGGAILGLILYAAVGILTGLIIGYVALAVGYIIAKAIKIGSRGVGGQRYQIAAALLTYVAVSMAAVPIGIAQYVKARDAHRAAAQASQSQKFRSEDPATGDAHDSAPSADAPAQEPNRPIPARHPVNFLGLLGTLVLEGLISPFSQFFRDGPSISAMIGLVILSVGIRIAWQMTDDSGAKGVLGPFKN
jgi:predicted lipid-binding transport protein (Tim44 family)